MTTAVHSAARVTQPKPKKIRKNRELEQHRIRARWTFDDPNNIKESCSAVGQKHWIANIAREERDRITQEQTCGRISM